MMKVSILSSIAVLVQSERSIAPVANLDVAAYTGRWYQTYVSLSAPFQTGATCVTADYGIASDGKTVTVKNSNQYNGVGLLSVEGYGAPNPNGSGELEVVLGRPGYPVAGIPEWGEQPTNYIVADVGPVVDGKYDYAIVTEPSSTILYVLARDVTRFQQQHEANVLRMTAELGFTGEANSPRRTQQTGCTYSDLMLLSVEEETSTQSIEPVADLDVAAYIGRWYQTYVSLSAPFQTGATCVTADYGIASDGKTVTVKNSNQYNGVGLLSVEGYGAPNPDGSGELEVVLGRPGYPVTGIPVWGEQPTNYIVAAVGPVVDGKYDYAIVTEPSSSILYVLARDVARFQHQHEENVLRMTAELGFTDEANSPRRTQQAGCTYSDLMLLSVEEETSTQSIEPVADLDVAAYIGRWYQTYVSLSAPFQTGATCVTAEYGIASDGKTVTVKNSNQYNGVGLLSVEGYGAPNPDGSGELEVVLGRPGYPVTGIPVWGEQPTNYIVAAVGPVVDGKYDYAIVTEPSSSILYVLARDVARFQQQHEEKVLRMTAELGFTGETNSPQPTQQEGCTYSDLMLLSVEETSTQPIEPVADLDVAAYIGRWYQTYVSLSAPFQTGATCVTADYGIASDGKTVTVKNSNQYNGVGLLSVEGYGAPNPDGSGELEVVLGRPGYPVTGIPVWGDQPTNYIVAAVGPVVDGKYDYAVVTEPSSSILYILARDVARFEQQHEENVLKLTADLGFTGETNSPHQTQQEGCTYNDLMLLSVEETSTQSIEPVADLDVAAYIGRWYQAYVSQSAPFQTGATCVTADYGIASDGKTVTVKNSNQYNGVGLLSVEGYGAPNPDGSGELEVVLGRPGYPVTGIPVWGDQPTNYIVAAVGPVVDGMYDYAIVTEPSASILYVLTRDVARFEQQHAADVLKLTTDMGFTGEANRPRRTQQEGCIYSDFMLLSVEEEASTQSIEPVADLDVAAYTGLWYQTYVSLSAPFQTGATCVTAEYGIASDGKTVTVKNSNQYNGAGLLTVEGYGAPNPDGSGELEVVLGRPGRPVVGIPVWGEEAANYIVAAVGPVVDGKYDYAIVTEPSSTILYILARDVARFEQQHEENVLKLTAELGFTTSANSPHKTQQEGCIYNYMVV